MCDHEHKIQEHRQLNENLRHYHNQRFAQMTLWLAITAGLMSVLFGESYAESTIATIVFKFLGILASLAFWIMDYRMVQHWRHFYSRLQEVEQDLGFGIWRDRPERQWWLGSTPATFGLYGTVTAFWFLTLLFPYVI